MSIRLAKLAERLIDTRRYVVDYEGWYTKYTPPTLYKGNIMKVAPLSAVDFINKVLALTPENLIDLPKLETLLNGIYVRQLYIPKGTLVTTYIHAQDNVNTLIYGSLKVFTEKEGWTLWNGFSQIVAKAYTQRIIIAESDSLIQNVFSVPLNITTEDEAFKYCFKLSPELVDSHQNIVEV